MKKREMVLKMQRFYGIRHVMLEGGYITLEQFMTELLNYQLHLGMLPPDQNAKEEPPCAVLTEWEDDHVKEKV